MSHYLVHWDDYQSNLQSACERQFLSESFVDVTLAVEEGLIKCHRVILSAASSYFQQLLAQHTHPHPIIFMRDMRYWEVIALVDFMYRGEVSVEEDKLEPLMRAAQALQIHGLSSCLKACLERRMSRDQGNFLKPPLPQDDGEDSQDSGESGVGVEEAILEPQVELSAISKLCELNSELELRPITPPDKKPSLPPLPELNPVSMAQRKVVKEEIDFIETEPQLSPVEIEPVIQIQSIFSEKSHVEDKAENSDDCIDVDFQHDQLHAADTPGPSHSQPHPQLIRPQQKSVRQFLLVRPAQPVPIAPKGPLPTEFKEFKSLSLLDPPLYKRYSPRVLEQALRDLHTGKFRSIRACARHHGIPMTTLRYRAKINTKRPPWMPQPSWKE